ncbi:unnamed protein product [Urochloa humidicola]
MEIMCPILTLPAPEGNGGDADQQPQAPPPPPPPGAKAEPPATVATHTRTIGIIHPPHNIRVIIEKTAPTWSAASSPTTRATPSSTSSSPSTPTMPTTAPRRRDRRHISRGTCLLHGSAQLRHARPCPWGLGLAAGDVAAGLLAGVSLCNPRWVAEQEVPKVVKSISR